MSKEQNKQDFPRVKEVRLTPEAYQSIVKETELFLLAKPSETLVFFRNHLQEKECLLCTQRLIYGFALWIARAVYAGSAEKWEKSGNSFMFPMESLAVIAADILQFPEYEFENAWPMTRTKMIEMCQRTAEFLGQEHEGDFYL